MKNRRIEYIDFLKVIGLTCIILAHVNAPDYIMMIRSFDVPLLVIISAILVSKSYEKYEGSIFKYYIKRFKRLVFPVWIFLVLFFLIAYLAFEDQYDVKYYIASFLLTRYGIGYVWIILIYLYNAILIPAFDKLKKIKYDFIIIIIIYIVYEILYYKGIGIDNKLLDVTFFYIVPYGCLSYLGFNYKKYSYKVKQCIASVFLILFGVLCAYYYFNTGSFQPVSIVKYPPRLYYLSYGIAISYILLVFCEKHDFKIYKNSIIKYISEHSLWIYLWHILMIYLYEQFKIIEVWYVKLIVVYFCAVILSLIVSYISKKLNKTKSINLLKYIN